ncbi:MAG: putative prophage phiRv2 integrase [bacterium ADurb.Bin243]|nr:MAG: putative prophage phiRv2 integrase [bacterium ADurb.Bin243]
MAGSIQFRGNNRWQLIYSAGYDGNGKRIRHCKTITATSKRAAEKELVKYISEIDAGDRQVNSNIKFADFIMRWLTEYAEPNLAPKTVLGYRKRVEQRIIPLLGGYKINQITPMILMKFYQKIGRDGIRLDGKSGKLSQRSILHNHRILSAVLQKAVEWQVLPSNPATRVPTPRVPRKEMRYLNKAQIYKLVRALETEPLKYKAAIILTVGCGLRLGEIMGLEWKDIDFEKPSLVVRRTSQYIPCIGIITKQPKSESSMRVITLPEPVARALKIFREYQQKERQTILDLWHDTDRLFVQWNGLPMHPESISKWFLKFQRRHNLSEINFHGLRHTSVSILANSRVPVKEISVRTGHQSVSTTLNLYGHMLEGSDRMAADEIGKVLSEYQEFDAENKGSK